MRKFILAGVLCAICCGAGAAADFSKYMGGAGVADVGDAAVIRSDEFAVAIRKSTGQIVALIDQRGKQDLASRTPARNLFTVGLSRPSKGERSAIPSSEFQKVKVETRSDAKSAELTARFSGAKDADLEVVCRFRVQKGSPLIYATVEVENRSTWAIPSVDFPALMLNPKIGEKGDDDVLLIPVLGGEMYKNPSATPVHTKPGFFMQYPGYAAYQMLAFFDDTAGLYLATYDAEGNVKTYRAESKSEGLDLTPHHQGPEVPGAGFKTDYPTVLGAIKGPWYNAADRYKEWASKQFWCRTKLADRTDAPDWLKSGPPFLLVYPRDPELNATDYKDKPDALIAAIDAYRRAAGVKEIMYTAGGWSRQGIWIGPYYFPTQPPEEWWKAFTDKAREKGIHVSLMTNGYKWTIKQNQPEYAPAFDFTEDFQRRHEMAITKADGSPMLVGSADKTGFMGGTRSRICRGSKEGQDFMADIFLRLAKMGVEMSSFDQDIGGGEQVPCYNPNHGHPPGFGKWMWESYRDLHIRILKETSAYVPHFVLYQEDENELSLPWQPTSWTRDFRILDHENFNGWGVPVFRYLYHEYASAIGAALFHGSGVNPAPETRAYAMARCLAYGLNQGEFFSHMKMNEQAKPESLASRAYLGFSKPLTDYSQFLILGTMLRPLELQCNNTRLPFRRQEEKGKPSFDFPLDLPAVVQGAYRAPDGRVGVILANATESKQQATIKLPSPYPGARREVAEFRNGTVVKKHKGAAGGSVQVSMGPLESVFLELD